MSPETTWPALSIIERRILGVLVEKAKTTPDVYPLSINSIVTGSNQNGMRSVPSTRRNYSPCFWLDIRIINWSS